MSGRRGTFGTRLFLCVLFMVAAAAPMLSSCDGKEGDDSLVLRVPSPAGSATIIKDYSLRTGSYIMKLFVKRQRGDARLTTIVTEARRGSRNGQEDGVVVGWIGDSHVTIGWRTGDAIPPGLPRNDDVEVAYINYEPDLAKTTPSLIEHVTLQNIRYVAEPRLDGPRGGCVIRLHGTDGKFFGDVGMDIVTGVYILSADGNKQYNPQRDSLVFTLMPLPEGRSPQLTPTQAKLGEIGPYATIARPPFFFVRQTSTTLEYGPFSIKDHDEVFRMLHDGNYLVRFNLTFGLSQIEYMVREPVGADVIASYQKCVADR